MFVFKANVEKFGVLLPKYVHYFVSKIIGPIRKGNVEVGLGNARFNFAQLQRVFESGLEFRMSCMVDRELSKMLDRARHDVT